MDKQHILKIIDILYNECISAGGDGDAIWYSRFYKVKDIFPLVKQYNDKLASPFELSLSDTRICWWMDQEWIIITNNEEEYKGQPDYIQFILKN